MIHIHQTLIKSKFNMCVSVKMFKFRAFLCGLHRCFWTFVAKFWVGVLNRTLIYNQDTFTRLTLRRDPKRGLITFSNHYSLMDDPFIWCLIQWRHVFFTMCSKGRWVPAAQDILFTSRAKSLFFWAGRCVAVNRGDGIYQPAMNFLVRKLNECQWVHVFPEGKVNKTKEYMRLKQGIGRLIAEPDVTPLVLPIFNLGFEDIYPPIKPYKLHIGKDVTVVVGETVDYTNMVTDLKRANKSKEDIIEAITSDIQTKLYHLRETTERLHYSRLSRPQKDTFSHEN